MNRQPAVAGTFYPANRQQLHQMLDEYLNDAETSAKVPKAIIAPHAGYIYSGPVAASAYAQLEKAHDRISRVVIIGPSPPCRVQWTRREQGQSHSSHRWAR